MVEAQEPSDAVSCEVKTESGAMPALGYARRAMKITPWIRDYPMDERELIG
jgi:hypothetical protein